MKYNPTHPGTASSPGLPLKRGVYWQTGLSPGLVMYINRRGSLRPQQRHHHLGGGRTRSYDEDEDAQVNVPAVYSGMS